MVKGVLREIPVFENLDRKQIDELSSWLQKKEFSAGDHLIEEGDDPDGMYVLARGKAEVVKSSAIGPLVLAQLESPSVCGEMGLLDSEELRSAGVRAKTGIIAGFLPAPLFAGKIAENNITALRISLNLGRIASSRLRATTRRLAALSEQFTRRALCAEHDADD
jgi:CRP-like cAMP-binding protein